jgi:hypothetical protein
MIQIDQIHAACSSTAEITAIDEKYERGAGHQMHLLSETLKQLECDDRLAEAAAALREALGALDDAYMAIYEFDLNGASDADQAAKELVEGELAAINRRLDMLLSLAQLKAVARRLGRAACRPEAAEGESDENVEH